MTSTTVVSIVAAVALAALLVVRQLRAQPVNANFRLPLILGIIGLIELTNYLQKDRIDPHFPNGGVAGASILLYLAITYTIQRLIVQARAQRIPVGDCRAESLTGSAP